jgi:hypothetical protein
LARSNNKMAILRNDANAPLTYQNRDERSARFG